MDSPPIPPGCNVVGIGIDQIEVARIQVSLDEYGSGFEERIFSPEERKYCRDKKNPATHYAARFAAKEAASKAFGTGFGKQFGWLDAEIIHGVSGEPLIRLSGRAEKLIAQKGGTKALVSLSHLESIACAIVILIKE